jgi:putative transposase
LAKSINDAAWYQFRVWVEYFGRVFGKITYAFGGAKPYAVSAPGTSQDCSACGATVKKGLSTRTHVCGCGCVLDRDHNAGRNILSRGLSTVGHTGTFGLEPSNAWGEMTTTLTGVILSGQVASVNQESHTL